MRDDRRGDGAGQVLDPDNYCNVESEAALLAALMFDNSFVAEISERLREEDFYEAVHGRVFKAIVRLVGNGRRADPITLAPLFALDREMEELGGASAYLGQITAQAGVALIGHREFAAEVQEYARMRRIIEAMIVGAQKMRATGSIAGAIDQLEQEIWTAADRTRPIRILGADEMIGLVQERHERINDQATSSVGARSRTVPEINAMLGGLEPKMMTILAARPGMGKSTTAISFAWGCAANGHPTFYGSAESSADMTALKVAADISYDLGARIEFERVKDGKLHRQETEQLEEAKRAAAQLPIRFADIGRMDTRRLEALVARECAYWESRDRQLELVVVDYMQLLEYAGEKDTTKRVGLVSKALLDMAKKYGLHVLALAQLSRKVEERIANDRRPMLSDLRDSGDIEQDADNVLFVHRPEFYLVDEKPKPNPSKPNLYETQLNDWECDMAEWRDKAELIGAKTRFGKRTSRRVKFLGDYSAVRSLTHRRPDSEEDDGGEDMFMGRS